MDPIISPRSTGISESGANNYRFYNLFFTGLTVFSHSLTILINMCVHRKLTKAILQAPSVDREGVS